MINFLNSLDTAVFLFFNGLHCDFLDRFMFVFSSKFVWVPLYAALLLVLVRTFRPRVMLVYLIGLVVAICIADQTCATLIRPFVERLRPSNLANPLSELVHVVNDYRGGRYGFPSCHAANSFAMAVFMLCLMRRHWLGWVLLVWAIVNSYSRVYLGVHYPGDLLCGAIIGSAAGFACYKVAHLFDKDYVSAHERFHRPVATFHPNLVLPAGVTVRTLDITLARVVTCILLLTIVYMAANAF